MSAILRMILPFVLIVLPIFSPPVAEAAVSAKTLSDATAPIVAAGIAAAYFGSPDSRGEQDAARVTDAVVLSYGAAQLIKSSVAFSADDTHRHGFPSGHVAVASAMAASLGKANPRLRWVGYTGAALATWGAMGYGHHNLIEVLGGAALGITVGKWSIASRDGLLIGRAFRF